MRLGVCAEFDFAVFFETNVGTRHEGPWICCAGHAAVYRERVDPKNGVFQHAGNCSVWDFFVG